MYTQREGMGLLEYQAMYSLRDLAHDGVLCTFINTVDQAQTGANGVVRQDRWHGRPLCTKSHPAGSLSSSQSGGPPCWASPLAFGLIDCTHRVHIFLEMKQG